MSADDLNPSGTPLWPWLQAPLQAASAQLNSHAALVHGPEGLGQFEFGLALAKSWLCEAIEPGQPSRMACGRCTGCHLIDAGSHPDLLVILPETLQAALGFQGGAAAEKGEGADKAASKAKKLSQEIKVEAMRAMVQFAQHTASRGRAKVVLVYPAERMNVVAANTLLKTLEEPPGKVRFILSGAELEALLPTVRSRCQAWRLALPAPDVAVPWLQTQVTGLSLDDARVLLAAAGGQPLTARERQKMGLDARYWAQIPRDLMQGYATTALSSWPLPMVLDTLQKICHDLACMAVGGAPRFFPASALPKAPELNRLTAWARELRKARWHDEHPWHAALKIESLLLQARLVIAD